MTSFEQMKTQKNSFDKLNAQLQKLNGSSAKQSYGDDRIWKPQVDKAGNGYAVLRFLPAPDGEDMLVVSPQTDNKVDSRRVKSLFRS